MANIGDLYYTFRGDGARLQADAKKEGAKAGDTGGKAFAQNFKQAFSGKEFGRGLVQGLGFAGVLGAANLAASGVQKLASVMTDAVQAAIEEEVSISKLDAALRANVDSYDGNTDAIERVLASRMRLGFADDEQRQSLATLLAVTKDYTKALDLQRTAMDLARLRNIDLQAASDIVGKVYGGNIGILSRYGIAIRKGATATEALATVQKLAGGQAEAYAETSAGKLLSSQILLGEALEKLGGIVLPAVVEGTEAVIEVLDSFFEAMDRAGQGVADNSEPMENFANILHDLFKNEEEPARTFLGTLFDGLNDVDQAVSDVANNLNDAWTFWDTYTDVAVDRANDRRAAMTREMSDLSNFKGKTKDDLVVVTEAVEDLGDEAEDTARKVSVSTGQMRDASRQLRDAWLADVNALINDYWQPTELRAELAALKVEETELRKIVASGDATEAQIADLNSVLRRQEEVLAELGIIGAATGEEVSAQIAAYQAKVTRATGDARKRLLEQIRLWVQLRLKILAASGAAEAYGGGAGGGIGRGEGGRASGGPVKAGQAYRVGEVGEELFVPNMDGVIIPNSQVDSAAAAMGGVTVNLTHALPPVRSVRDIGSQLRDLEYTGWLGGR